MTKEKLNEILTAHKLWLQNEDGGRRADLCEADLSKADLSGVNLSEVNLCEADLSGANLSRANLSKDDLSWANLSGADLSWADLSGANLMSNISFLEAHFERTTDGYIVYKCFGAQYSAPEKWEIKPGCIIGETVNPLRTCDCGSGINVAPLEWVRRHYDTRPVWELLIRWEWLAGVVCPYNSDGKIRCERAELVEVVEP